MRLRLHAPRRVRLAVATIGIALMFLPTATAQAPTGENLITGGPRPDLVLMYTGEVLGNLKPSG